MADYKETLNLPKTAFPMKANLSQREPEMLAHWQALDLYQQTRERAKGKKKFIYHHGPPYANGAIHLGHALNMSLKDFVVKSKLLSGYDTAFVPGWDCHGLPIELNVEKKKGRVGDKISKKDFRQACREYASQQVSIQKASFQRLGVLADWDKPYLTMNYNYEAATIGALKEIIKKDHMHSGFKPVHWCLDCGSALAEAEVEYKDKVSPAVDVCFDVLDTNQLSEKLCVKLPAKSVSVPIWTTTPWTLPANEAVCLHADLMYVLLELDNRCLIIAEELLATLMQRINVDQYQVLHRFAGKALEGIQLQHPLYDEKHVPVILGEHVTTDAGTGAVHTAPGHGDDDYKVGLKYDLPITNPVNARGVYFEETPLVGGMHIYKANPFIVETLKEKGRLLCETKIEHSYPHCWRHKTPLLFRATPQWFISMDKHGLRNQALDEIKKVKWTPSFGENRLTAMIEGRPDWCISRQRTWGVPICVFAHKKTGELHPRTIEFMTRVENLVKEQGVDAWDDVDINEWLGDEAADYDKVTDILDVWFDSGVSHIAVLDAREELASPADLYLEGSDQHRGWFQTSLLTSCAIKSQAPFKQVLTHGFTVDADGRKMSKSLGNVMAPEKLFNQLGADILRLWVSSTDYRYEITVSDEIFKRTADSYRRIRNTARFLLANLHDFNPSHDLVAVDQLIELDRWVLCKAQKLQSEIISAYENYQFHKVHQALMHFCSIELGSFYLDVIKDRQYTAKTNGVPRRSAQTVIYYIVEMMARWMAPILSYTADEIWRYIPGEREASVFLQQWYSQAPDVDDIDLNFWQDIMPLRDAVNKAIEQQRSEGELGSSLEAHVILYVDDKWYQALSRIESELKFVLITSNVTLNKMENDTHYETDIEGVMIHVDVINSNKCERCWHRNETVGANETYTDICSRCIENIHGEGEVRHYA